MYLLEGLMDNVIKWDFNIFFFKMDYFLLCLFGIWCDLIIGLFVLNCMS